ncbi:lipopolysaccharide transport periplasmic protein LptA [Sulfurihydrogenibium sp.]|jgi:lipopolysaccharide export system protein LptA|uniref:lipopolysaccharide transport periplasmic protein LptA n=1 Tax=Sulfurihydrogenibium sp. TaxID=2053621 RepID=UPI0026204C51|nr:lipopolysaccharide transport periplasmic protein LptA [Sulfurihydrogenibium sp.]
MCDINFLINKESPTFLEFFASRIYKIAFFIILCFVLVAYSQEKKETNKKEPVVITADKLEYSNKDKIAIYTGKVEAIKGNIKLNADMMKIFLDDKGDVSKIIATGNVYFEQENKWGKGKEAEYYKDKNLIILRKDAEVHQDKNVVEGDEIYYYIDEEKAIATSKTKRVRSIIFPKEKQQ